MVVDDEGNYDESAIVSAFSVKQKDLIPDDDGEYFRNWRPEIESPDDIWNEIPWTEALQGLDVLTLAYDSQASIYNVVEELLSEAEVLLNGENGGFAITGDIIYNGDVEKWKKLVSALQARSALHWSLQNPQNYAMISSNLDVQTENPIDIIAES